MEYTLEYTPRSRPSAAKHLSRSNLHKNAVRIRCAEYSDKHVRTKRNATAPVEDRHGVPGKVGKQLLAGAVLLAHRTFERLRPVAVALAELGVAVGTLAEVRLNVLLPQ